MNKNWEECSKEELILNFNVVNWCLREKLQAQARIKHCNYYVLPKFCEEQVFLLCHLSDMQNYITSIIAEWTKRYGSEKIPRIELIIMTEQQWHLEEMGWEMFKEFTIKQQKRFRELKYDLDEIITGKNKKRQT